MRNEINTLLGSKMLKLNNCRDEDWVIFIEKHPKGEERNRKHRSIEFFRNFINHFITGKDNTPTDVYKSCFIYQLSKGFHDDENYPFKDFNILEHKTVWIEQLKGYMNCLNTEQLALSSEVLYKTFYHILYQYNMMLENTHFISDEAKVDVQKIHDYEMPSSYFYELRDMINSL